MTVGERIKNKRLELNLSQEELALKCGYKSRSSVNKIELARDLPLNKIQKMADALGVSPSYLMGWEDEVPEFEEEHVEMIELYSRLTKEEKQTIMNLLRSLAAGHRE